MSKYRLSTYLDEEMAVLFQGVGLDYRQYINKFNEKQWEDLKRLSEITEGKYGVNIYHYLTTGIVAKEKRALTSWIAIYVCDYIIYKYYVECGIKPKIFLGYSLGLITASVCGDAISFEEGLDILCALENYSKDKKEVGKEREGMATVVGLTKEIIEDILIKNNMQQDVFIASENNESCIVLSGYKKQIDIMEKLVYEEGALKFVDLGVTSALHSRFSIAGIDNLVEKLDDIEIRDSKIPIMSVLHKEIIQNSNELRKELIDNMCCRMYWKDCMNKIQELGVKTFIEVGLGDWLTKISKIINFENKYITYDKLNKMLD